MTPTNMDKLNRELAGKLGIPWYEITFPECGVTNPDFVTNPTLVLREIMKQKKLSQFRMYLDDPTMDDFTADYILDTAEGKFARAALKWMGKGKV